MGCVKLCGSFHITPEPGQGLRPIVIHCFSPSLCGCFGPGSVQCEYTIMIWSHLRLSVLLLIHAEMNDSTEMVCKDLNGCAYLSVGNWIPANFPVQSLSVCVNGFVIPFYTQDLSTTSQSQVQCKCGKVFKITNGPCTVVRPLYIP